MVIDPIDGSLNARRTMPSHSLSFAVASGPSMAEVEFGYVYDFGAGEEFSARRGGGAFLDGEPILPTRRSERRLVVVGLESAKPEFALPALETLAGEVYRLRVVGSIAISLAYVAAGRLDGMLSLRPCRSVDVGRRAADRPRGGGGGRVRRRPAGGRGARAGPALPGDRRGEPRGPRHPRAAQRAGER